MEIPQEIKSEVGQSSCAPEERNLPASSHPHQPPGPRAPRRHPPDADLRGPGLAPWGQPWPPGALLCLCVLTRAPSPPRTPLALVLARVAMLPPAPGLCIRAAACRGGRGPGKVCVCENYKLTTGSVPVYVRCCTTFCHLHKTGYQMFGDEGRNDCPRAWERGHQRALSRTMVGSLIPSATRGSVQPSRAMTRPRAGV